MKLGRKWLVISVAGALAACVCAGWLRLQLRSPDQISVEVVSCRFREHQYSLEMEAELVLRVGNSSMTPALLRIVTLETNGVAGWELDEARPASMGQGLIIPVDARGTLDRTVVVPAISNTWRLNMEVCRDNPTFRERLKHTWKGRGHGYSWREAWRFSRHLSTPELFKIVSPPIRGLGLAEEEVSEP